MKIGVLSDTHIPKRAKDLPPKAYELLQGVDAIIHAGDVLTHEFLNRLEAIAPVYAVLGNNDIGMKLPEQVELQWHGVNVAIIHDSGDSKGRAARMKRRFPHADAVVFGHSHIPWNECIDNLLLFNPGSPTDRRRQPNHTMGILHLDETGIRGEILTVD